MKRISVRRVASVIVTAMAMTLVFATLGSVSYTHLTLPTILLV